MSLTAYNERIKLTATYVNGVAIAVFAVGGFAPILGFLAASAPPNYRVSIFVVICFSAQLRLTSSCETLTGGSERCRRLKS